MPNLLLTIKFNGSRYHGWQRQSNAISVEQTLANAIKKVTGESPDITGCSRTDAGVHALEYVCSFVSNTSIPAFKLPMALNTVLPNDIRAQSCSVERDSFNARFSAISKTYIYKAYNSQISNPFLNDFAYHFPYKIDFNKMKKAAVHFIGHHDFSAFMATGGAQKSTIRDVEELEVTMDNEIIQFRITATAYLYNMVRIIAGTLLYVGIGKIDESEIPSIIIGKDRTKSGFTAGAKGLYLEKVRYGGCNEK